MAELFEFGLDFGLSYFEPIPKKKSLTQEEYQKGNIDYYDQTLGALGGDFEIPERTDDDDKDRKNINNSITNINKSNTCTFYKDTKSYERTCNSTRHRS